MISVFLVEDEFIVRGNQEYELGGLWSLVCWRGQ